VIKMLKIEHKAPKIELLSKSVLSDAVGTVSTASLAIFGAGPRGSLSPDASRSRYHRLCNPSFDRSSGSLPSSIGKGYRGNGISDAVGIS
jgi:hypothetical protein